VKKAIFCILTLLAVNLIGGDEKRGYIGVQLALKEQLDHNQGKASQEITISHVYEGTGAEQAGLESGDVVVKLNGVDITSHAELNDALSEYQSGETINLTIRRGDLDMDMDVVLGDQPEAKHFGNRWVEVHHKDRAFAGLELMGLNDQLAEYFGVEGGTLVKKVTEDGPSAQAGIKAGDIILRWGEEDITNANQITKALHKINPGDTVSVTVLRKGNRKTFDVTTGTTKGFFGDFNFMPKMRYEFKGLEGLEGLHSLEALENLPNFEFRMGEGELGDIKVEMKELGEQLKNLKVEIREKVKDELKEERKEDN
jgi:S1-C subfamily serine protease